MRLLRLAVLMACAAACALPASHPPILDMTQVVIPPSDEGAELSFSFSFPNPPPRPPSPLRVELLRVDRARYRRMDPIVYDVRISNASARPVIVPVSPVPIAKKDRPSTGYRHALVEFELVPSHGRDVAIGMFVLYGAPTVRRSLMTLRPNESISFRLPAVLAVEDPTGKPGAPLQMPDSVHAKVEVSIFAPGDPMFENVLSASSPALDTPIEVVNPPARRPAPYREAPAVHAVSPQRTSPGCKILLDGLRFGLARPPGPIVSFISTDGGPEYRARTGSGWYSADPSPDAMAMIVHVPPDLRPGSWNVVVEVDGRRSAPVTVQVGDWAGPRIERLPQTTANPGTDVELYGDHFRDDDVLEMTDAQGVVHTSVWNAWPVHDWFNVPMNFPLGDASVRIRAKGPRGEDVVSDTLKFSVTADPLPIKLAADDMMSVAPGQWTGIAWTGSVSIRWWDRLDVEITQAGRTHSITLSPAGNGGFHLPSGLSGGDALVRVRSWHGQVASAWSEAQHYVIADKPVPPKFFFLNAGPTRQEVPLPPAPDAVATFEAQPGDDLGIGGYFPIARGDKLRVTLERARERRHLMAVWPEFGLPTVQLPKDLPVGEWAIVVAVAGAAPVRLPVTMRVVRVQ